MFNQIIVYICIIKIKKKKEWVVAITNTFQYKTVYRQGISPATLHHMAREALNLHQNRQQLRAHVHNLWYASI